NRSSISLERLRAPAAQADAMARQGPSPTTEERSHERVPGPAPAQNLIRDWRQFLRRSRGKAALVENIPNTPSTRLDREAVLTREPMTWFSAHTLNNRLDHKSTHQDPGIILASGKNSCWPSIL